MNSMNAKQPDIVIDLKELLWDLLSRWKIILIVSVIFAIIVAGLLYLRADQQYQAALKASEAVKASNNQSVEERSAAVMKKYGLSEEDQRTVLYLTQQQETIKTQEEYLSSSIWLNLNPYSHRTLTLTYYIKGEEGIDLQALVDGYEVYLQRGKLIRELGDIVSPGTELKYIYELVDGKSGNVSDSGSTGIDYSVTVVLPEDVDASDIETVIEKAFRKARASLGEKIGHHTITLIDREDFSKYDSLAVDRKNAVTNSINALQTNIQNFRTKLSPEQVEALNEISSIYDSKEKSSASLEESADAETIITKPGISKKYLLAGLLLGIFLCVGIYTVLLLVRRRITTEDDLEMMTGARSLGTIGWKQPRNGMNRFTHSNIVDRFRYRKAREQSAELGEMISSMRAICNHVKTDNPFFLQLTDPDGEGYRIVKNVCSDLNEEDLNVNVIDLDESVNEKDLIPVHDAFFLVEEDSNAEILWRIVQICRQFDVQVLGCVFLEKR